MTNLVRIFLLTASFFALVEVHAQKPAAKKVILISWDGLRPEFFLKPEFETPNLRKLMAQGTVAERVKSVFPSLTYPSHTSMVTGVRSAAHGVLSNTTFRHRDGTHLEWYWDAKHIQSRSLWQAAKEKGKTVAVLRWPVTRGADVDWLVPEVFSVPGVFGNSDREVVEQSISAKLKEEFAKNISVPLPTDDLFEPFDVWNIEAASYLHKKYHPDLILLHLCNVDRTQHETGSNSKETKDAVRQMDVLVGKLLQSIDLKSTCLFIVGDHGHADFSKTVHINNLFRDQGWIIEKGGKIQEWKVMAHVSGSQAAVYVKDKSLMIQVQKILKEHARGHFVLIEKSEMLKLGVYPDADFAVSANIGMNLSGKLSKELVLKLDKTQSTHGYLPSAREMDTGFIGVGCGIKPGTKLKEASLLQIAPTIAKILDLKFSKTEKKELPLLFE